MGVAARRTPPYRIETDRLVIRCWDPRDAPSLRDELAVSAPHLLPWLPWAEHEPAPLADVVARLRGFRAAFDRDEDYVYGVFSADESRLVGGTGLHTRVGLHGLEIGYWIAVGEQRQGLATEVTAALTRAAIEHAGVDRVEIGIDTENAPSLRVPRRLGYVEEATLRRRLPIQAGHALRDEVIFTLLASELAASPCAAAAIRCFDAAGRAL